MTEEPKPEKVHPYFRKEKGAVVAFNGKCAFLNPGDTFKDMRGRKYRVAEDGSLRRVK